MCAFYVLIPGLEARAILFDCKRFCAKEGLQLKLVHWGRGEMMSGVLWWRNIEQLDVGGYRGL